MSTPAGSTTLADLAAKLTDPRDRETYAELIAYVRSLPPEDELFRLMELLGLLSLLGQRLPEALGEFLVELREQTKIAEEHHAQLDQRLASLPSEISLGVDVQEIARAMSESLRQQLIASGLQDTATLLRSAAKDINGLASGISAALKPLTQEHKGLAATIYTELGKLTMASRLLREHNAHLVGQENAAGRRLKAALALALFLSGGVCGIFLEKRETTDVLSNLKVHMEQMQAPSLPPVAPTPTKSPRQGGARTKP